MLATLLGSATRARLLAILLAEPPGEYHLRELIRLVGGGASGVQREVARLEDLGLLVTRRSEGGRRLVSAAESHPLLEPLRALVAAEAAEAGAAPAPTGNVNPQGDDLAAAAAEALHPALRPHLAAVLTALRDADVRSAVVFGSATQTDAASTPADLDVLVRLGGPARGRAVRYFTLRRALEQATGLAVDLVEDEALDNPYLREEIARTGVTLVAAA